MKLRYLFTVILAAILFAGCSVDNDPTGPLSEITLSDTYVSIPSTGGSAKLTVQSAADWSIINVVVDEESGKQQILDSKGKATDLWCSLSQLTGNSGSTDITISAPAFEGGREAEIQIMIDGKKQFFRVRQGNMTATTATCAEVIAGVDGKNYQVEGTCTTITQTVYGNWLLNDGTGEITIYGTLDKEGKPQNFASLGIEVGDVVKVQGPRATYGSTIELKDVTVISIKKWCLKIVSSETTLPKEGGELEVKVAYKGSGAYASVPEEYADWITYKSTKYIAGVPTKIEPTPPDTAIVKFDVMPNTAGGRSGKIEFMSSNGKDSTEGTYTFIQDGSIIEAPIVDFLAAADRDTQYRMTGVVTGVTDMGKGRFTISDYSGEVYVFNCNLNGHELKLGDIVTLTGKYDKYKGTEEVVSGIVENSIAVKEASIADFRAAEDNKSAYYMLTGKIVKSSEKNTKWDLETYGNFAIQDENGNEVYVYGLTSGWGGPSKQCGKLGLSEGDAITIIGYHTSYKGLVEVGGAFLYKGK